MTHKKKGQLTTHIEWAKHLRKIGKRIFWKGEREAEKRLVSNELKELNNHQETKNFICCLVGNIADEIEFGENKELRKGNKQFRPGAKVYCFPPLWSDGYISIKVIGKPRKSKKMITVVIPSKHITNWRKQKVYNQFIIDRMIQNNGWSFDVNSESNLDNLLNSLLKNRMS